MNNGRTPAKADMRKIRLFGFALLVFGLCGSNASALDLMGPPTAEIEKGMFRAGIDYTFSDMDLELIEGKGTTFRNGELLGSGSAASQTISGFEVNTLYAIIGYGVFENCEAFVRMGAANATFGDSLWDEGEDFDSDIDFAIGAGIKANFYKGFDWKIGGVIQINRAELDGKLNSSSWVIPQPQLVDISTTEIQIAIGATYMHSRRLSIYGGPFAHFISGDFDFQFNRVTDEFFDVGKFSWQINEGPTYGGYLGAQYELTQNISGNIEYQNSSNADVFGLSLLMKY
ncbi:MAG: hypothetical protein JXA81_01875 [Sedimentisphaerales bacterium]|nr:hypothetical protein [Sedimentisphaerales bacterium]